MLASVHSDIELLVPQSIYHPPFLSDENQPFMVDLVMFNVHGQKGCGISCEDMLRKRYAELKGSEDVIRCPQEINLWILASLVKSFSDGSN